MDSGTPRRRARRSGFGGARWHSDWRTSVNHRAQDRGRRKPRGHAVAAPRASTDSPVDWPLLFDVARHAAARERWRLRNTDAEVDDLAMEAVYRFLKCKNYSNFNEAQAGAWLRTAVGRVAREFSRRASNRYRGGAIPTFADPPLFETDRSGEARPFGEYLLPNVDDRPTRSMSPLRGMEASHLRKKPLTRIQRATLQQLLRGKSIDEIAARFRVSAGAIHDRLRRAHAHVAEGVRLPSQREPVTDVDSAYLKTLPARWQRAYRLLRMGKTRRQIARAIHANMDATKSLLKRLRRALEARLRASAGGSGTRSNRQKPASSRQNRRVHRGGR